MTAIHKLQDTFLFKTSLSLPLFMFGDSVKTNPPHKVARSKKIKRPNLAISSFKKGQIIKNEKKAKWRPNFLQKFV